MNKKLHLLVAALGLFIGSSVNAQTVLSQTGGAVPDDSTIYCPLVQQGQVIGQSETSYYRAYTIPSNMQEITSVKIGIGTVDLLSSLNSFPLTVTLHKSNGAFPGSYPSGLTQLATATTSVTASDDESIVTVSFSAPVSVASGDIIVAEVSNADVTGGRHFFGVISGSETDPAYILANNCSITTPTSIGTLTAQDENGNPVSVNGKNVIDLSDEPLSVENFFKENFSMYPNPVTDILNIDAVNGLNANEIRVMDLTGKVLKVQNNASSVNVADLATGTYLIEITTNEGKGTSKFIKK